MNGRPVRILLLGPLPPPYGGPEVMTRTLLDGLRSRSDVEISHLNTQVSRSLAEKGGQHQLRKSLRAARQLLQLIYRILVFRPAGVYLPLTNSPSFLGFVRDAGFILLARAFGRDVIVRLHGGYYYYAHTTGLKRRFVAFVLRGVRLAMVQGARLVTAFDGLIATDRIAVVPNGLDAAPFDEARRRGAKRDRKKPRVLFVGLLCEEKGLEDLVAAMPHVAEAEFVFLGEWGSEAIRQRVMEKLSNEGTTGGAYFAGVVSGPEKFDWYVSSDVFVFPSYFVYEGHAVSSVEALAAGLPIVCTDHGALDESVRDGWNGFFIPARDPAAIAEKLNAILGDSALREQMGKRSRERFEERFTMARFVESWSDAVRMSFRAAKTARNLGGG